METEKEVEDECKSLGTKSALPKIITTMRSALNLGSFFTTGTDEVRQWTLRNGTKAPQAAGVIHGGESFFPSGPFTVFLTSFRIVSHNFSTVVVMSSY